MINDQDKRAVESMARCGIELEGLIEAFPKFPAEDIIEIYQEIRKLAKLDEDVDGSINYS